jgi:AraC family transcriptional regulator of adaptative response/methylated-DNA-[protein]-cysteine methyltransferase
VSDVCDHLRAANGSADLARAAALVGKTPTHVRRLFKRILGMTPGEWMQARRRERLQGDLRAGHTVSRAQFDAGYSSSSRLYESSDVMLGMTPARYKNGGAGVTIRFGFGLTSLGQILVATTNRGVCSVKIGTNRRQLETQLREEFPAADVRREDEAVDLALTRILEAIEHGGPRPEIPIDIQATAFQARVWRALSKVPRGETRTYLEIAGAIGAPNAVRAVASACAANPVAVVIPCHRIVRTDGSMGGYRWGIERAQTLLQREGASIGVPNRGRSPKQLR